MNHVEHLELLLYINYTSIEKYNHTEGVRASTYGFWGLQLSAWLGSPEMCICYPPIGLGFLSLSSLRATPNSWSCHISSMDRLCLCLAAKLLQSCPTLCGPRDGSPPGTPVPGTLQARVLEWVAIAFSLLWTKYLCIPSSHVEAPTLNASIQFYKAEIRRRSLW